MIMNMAALLLASLGGAPPAPSAVEPIQFAQLVVREQIIIRVPMRMRRLAPPNISQIEWKESKGPKCVSAGSILGATLLGQNSVDLILRDNRRVRAQLESCPALDYYYGFYLSPNADGRICADRDVIRSRMGGQCGIERFRALKPVSKD